MKTLGITPYIDERCTVQRQDQLQLLMILYSGPGLLGARWGSAPQMSVHKRGNRRQKALMKQAIFVRFGEAVCPKKSWGKRRGHTSILQPPPFRKVHHDLQCKLVFQILCASFNRSSSVKSQSPDLALGALHLYSVAVHGALEAVQQPIPSTCTWRVWLGRERTCSVRQTQWGSCHKRFTERPQASAKQVPVPCQAAGSKNIQSKFEQVLTLPKLNTS